MWLDEKSRRLVAQATSSTYETALRASGVDGVVTCLSSQQRRKNTLQIGAAASGFLVGWSTEANCMVGGSRVWCGDISHGTVRQKRSSSSCSPSITQSSWKKVGTEHLTNESQTRFQTHYEILARLRQEQGRQNSFITKNERMRQRPFDEVL